MQTSTTTLPAADGCPRFLYSWLPDDAPRAVVHIAHGMAEHAARYGRLAEALAAAGFAVYANDHRGHGQTASEAERGVFADEGGWSLVIADLRDFIENARAQHPDVPVVLMGHSMGSLMTQQYLYEHGDTIDAAVLSGTSGKPPAIATVGRYVARFERWRLGKRGRSKIIDALTFQDFNRKFKPNRTGFDWLSRDNAEVDKYIADPLSGFLVSVQLWIDVLDAITTFTRTENQQKIRKDLPIYIFAGDKDPVGEMGASVKRLERDYQAVGIQDVTCTLYPDARHETLNETNRDQVTADLIAWLSEKFPA
ncbi:MAG: alpha/beta hydrolase [Myxococcota bacterium]